MKKNTNLFHYLCSIFCFIAVIFVGDRLLSKVISNIVLNSGTKFSTTYRGGQQNGIIILGNSRGESSFSPNDIAKSTGLSTFQLSHKGISTEIIECLWKDYLDNNSPPKIVILELTNISSTNKAIYSLKSFMYWSENFSNLLKKEDEISYLFSKFSNLFIWNGEILFRSLYFIGKSDQNKIIHNTKKLSNETAIALLSKTSNKERKVLLKQSNLKALYRMIKLANKYNVSVHLIFPPYVPQYAERIKESKNNLIKKILINTNNIDNVFIHDMSNSITNIQMFEDLTHLNYYGSKQLLKLLLGKKILPTN